MENLFLDVHRQLTAWSVLIDCGVPLDELEVAADLDALAARLNHLIGPQWSNRWIKATNQRRRAHTPKLHDRRHGSVHRILRGPPA